MKLSLHLLFPLLLLGLVPLCGSAAEPLELEKLRSDFEKEMSSFTAPIIDLNGKYKGYLEQQRDAFQKSGNLDAMLVVEAELKGFQEGGTDVSSLPEIERLQKIYHAERERLEKEGTGKSLPVIQEFQKKAEELAARWTRAGRIEDAKLAKAESERLGELLDDGVRLALSRETTKMAGQDGFHEGTNPGEEATNSIKTIFCWIPPGKFEMGSPKEEAGRAPETEEQVTVSISEGFWMSRYEVTQEEYESVMGTNPSQNLGDSRRPVDQVKWTDATEYCEKLAEKERNLGLLPKGWTYSLPTEAEWEYACRAGTPGPYSSGELDEVGWFQDNSENYATHTVGLKKPNAWGLHDMHGNAKEWCLDWHTNRLEGGRDPKGPSSGKRRVMRGGSWYSPASGCRAAFRASREPSGFDTHLGFRVVVTSER